MKKVLRIIEVMTVGSKFKTAVLWFFILSIIVILDSYIGLKPYIQYYFGAFGVFVGKLLTLYYTILIGRIGGEYIQDFINRNKKNTEDENIK